MLTNDSFPTATRRGRLNLRSWLLGAALVAWTGGGLEPPSAAAENLKFTGAGFATEPRGGDRFWYGFAFAQRPRRDAGVLIVKYEPGASKDGISTIVFRNLGTTLTITPVVQEGEVVGAVAKGRADLQLADGKEQHNLPILVGIREDRLDLAVTAKDGAVGSNGVVMLGGNSTSVMPPGAVLLLAGAGESADEDGNLVQVAMGAIVTPEHGNRARRTVEGPACGRFVAEIDGGLVAIDAVPDRGDIRLTGAIASNVNFSGPATVVTQTPDGPTSCEGPLDFLAEIEQGRNNSAAGESQANRRYLYFAKIADCGVAVNSTGRMNEVHSVALDLGPDRRLE